MRAETTVAGPANGETASESRPQPDLTDVRNGSNYTVYLVKPFVKVKKEGQEKRIGVPEIPSGGPDGFKRGATLLRRESVLLGLANPKTRRPVQGLLQGQSWGWDRLEAQKPKGTHETNVHRALRAQRK